MTITPGIHVPNIMNMAESTNESVIFLGVSTMGLPVGVYVYLRHLVTGYEKTIIHNDEIPDQRRVMCDVTIQANAIAALSHYRTRTHAHTHTRTRTIRLLIPPSRAPSAAVPSGQGGRQDHLSGS